MTIGLLSFAPFPLQTLRFTLGAKERIKLKHFPGSQLRGSFNDALRAQECRLQDCDCNGCPQRSFCAYAGLFKPDLSHLPDAGKTSDYPRPYILHPSPAPNCRIAPGERYRFDLTLVGTATAHAAAAICAVITAGESGIGAARGKYELESVSVVGDEGEAMVYPCQTSSALIPPPRDGWLQLFPSDCQEVVISFITQLALRKKEEFLKAPPSFALLMRVLLPRICRLSAYTSKNAPARQGDDACPYRVTSQGCPDATACEELKSAADQIRLVDAKTMSQQIPRHSSRTDQWMKLQGLVGTATYRGNLTPFLPLLYLGEIIHVGKNVVCGLGKYHMEY